MKTILPYSALALGLLLSGCGKEDSVKNAFSCLSGTVIGQDYCGGVVIKLDQPDPKLLKQIPYQNEADRGFITVLNSFAEKAVVSQHLAFNLKIPTKEERVRYARICQHMHQPPTIPGVILEVSECDAISE